MRPISDETLAQILARAAALLELAAERERARCEALVPHGLTRDAVDCEDSAEACLRAARVLRGRA